MEKPVNPAGSVGIRVTEHPVPFEYTEEGLEAAAMRVPPVTLENLNATTQTRLDKAADSIINEITGGNVPSGTAADKTPEELAALVDRNPRA